MRPSESSCELPNPPPAGAGGSRVIRFQQGFCWEGVPATDYKQAAEHWSGVARKILVGDRGETTAFQVRYFELAAGGFTSFEEHAHEHAVVVLRGRGQVRLKGEVYELGFG